MSNNTDDTVVRRVLTFDVDSADRQAVLRRTADALELLADMYSDDELRAHAATLRALADGAALP